MPPAPQLNLGDDDMDVTMGGMPEIDIAVDPSVAGDAPPGLTREDSPLSELGEDEENQLARDVAEQNTTMFEPDQEQEPEDEASIHQARSKRRRVIGQDAETMLSTATLREQQQNRDKILKVEMLLVIQVVGASLFYKSSP